MTRKCISRLRIIIAQIVTCLAGAFNIVVGLVFTIRVSFQNFHCTFPSIGPQKRVSEAECSFPAVQDLSLVV